MYVRWIALVPLLSALVVPGCASIEVAVPGCRTNDDCGKDRWCLHTTCGVASTCVEEIPCSAAAPFLACGCSGQIVSLSAGCPDEKSGWATGGERLGAVEGEPCDPADQEAFRYSAQITFQGAETLGAKRLLVKLLPEGEAPLYGFWSEPTADAVATLDDALRPSWGKVKGLVLATIEDDSTCDPAKDNVWSIELSWTGRPAGDRVETTLNLVAPDPAACAGWNAN